MIVEAGLCRHTWTSAGVHHFVFTSASQETITQWTRDLQLIYEGFSPQRAIRVLTDARCSVLPPLAHAVHLSDILLNRRAPCPPSRHAILHRDALPDALAESLFDSLLRETDSRIRFFGVREHDHAMRWLLQA
jgi:hypothetical protein